MQNYFDMINHMEQQKNSFDLVQAVDVPPPDPSREGTERDYQLADYQYEILKESIRAFEASLDENHEVAFLLASFGQSVLFNVTAIGYSNPSLLHFFGFVDGKKAELVQNINQLNFLLMAVHKDEPDRPARRIGFNVKQDASE